MFIVKSVLELKWKIALFTIIALNALFLPNSVSASPVDSTIRFDRTNYTLGSNGTMTVYLEAVFDVPEQVIFLAITLYFVQVSSSILRTTPVVQNYYPPINITAHSTVPLAFSFQMPNDSNIVSGRFYCQETVDFRYGTSAHSQHYSPPVSEAYFQSANLQQPCTLTNPSQPSYLGLKDDLHSVKDIGAQQVAIMNSRISQYNNHLLVTLAAIVVLIGTTIFFAVRRQRVKTVEVLLC